MAFSSGIPTRRLNNNVCLPCIPSKSLAFLMSPPRVHWYSLFPDFEYLLPVRRIYSFRAQIPMCVSVRSAGGCFHTPICTVYRSLSLEWGRSRDLPEKGRPNTFGDVQTKQHHCPSVIGDEDGENSHCG
ncbi:hypothetical protein LXL04_037478 [Taraxacum kok-saghyz]